MACSSPRDYAGWAAALDRFASGDDSVLEPLEGATIERSPGLAERFARRVHDAYLARLGDVQRRLQRSLDVGGCDAQQLGHRLVSARALLAPLARFARLPPLPADLAAHLVRELEQLTRSVQQSLEDSARADPRSRDALLHVIRRHPLGGMGAAPVPTEPAASLPAPPPGARRNILLR